MYGGAQEDGLRPGTYDTPGIVGFGTAARLALDGLDVDTGFVTRLRDRLESGIRRVAPRAVIPGSPEHRLPNTVNVCIPGEDNRDLVLKLDLKGVAASAGAACAADSSEPSHVLVAMGLPEDLARSSIRFSLGSTNTEADVDRAISALKSALGGSRPRRSGVLGALAGKVSRGARRA